MAVLKWDMIYEKAIRDDGSLFFPEKLSQEFLDNARRTMGSYLFANQYLNEIIPEDMQTFKKEWFRYFEKLPKDITTFVYIDPALSEADTSDFTGVVVVHVDSEKKWYVDFAKRLRITPTRLVEYIFEINAQFKPNVIGIEEVAYQKALLYFLDEEMRRRGVILPVKGIKPPNNKTKQTRILSLVPRFEWQRILLSMGLHDLELELLQFPRAVHDDLIDALASIEMIYYPPEVSGEEIKKPNSPNDSNYERWYIQNIYKRNQEEE
jgi:predicted phage terminase large subunit-like protein